MRLFTLIELCFTTAVMLAIFHQESEMFASPFIQCGSWFSQSTVFIATACFMQVANMAKRALKYPLTQTPPKKFKEAGPSPPLSPGNITCCDNNATINAMVACVSPIKPSKYFDGELTDGDTVMRFVGFRKEHRQLLHSFCEQRKPIIIKNCQVQLNKFKNQLEVVLKSSTQVELSTVQFDVDDLKTVGSAEIPLNELQDHDEYDRVTIRAQVMRANEPQKVGMGKLKQEVILADSTATAMITLWETDVNMLIEGKSYQMSKLVVRSFLGKQHLSFPPTGSTLEEIDHLENVIIPDTPLDDDDDEYLVAVTVTGIQQFEYVYTCINCKKPVRATTDMTAECDVCHTTQRMSNHRFTAKLFIQAASDQHVTLRAYHDAITTIAQKDGDIKAEDLLFASPFDVAYNKYHVITKVSRK